MRTIPVICIMLLLTSCPKKQVLPMADDSPIIISGGSTVLENPNATLTSSQDAEVTTVSHMPKALGFLCDPDPTKPNPCATVCPQGANTTRCRVDNLDTHNNWDLLLCEKASCSGNGDVRMDWIASNSFKVKIHANNGSLKNPNPGQIEHAGPSLQSAKLALHGGGNPTYDFSSCTTGQTCLIISYK